MLGPKYKKEKKCTDDTPTTSFTEIGEGEMSLSSTHESETFRIRSQGTLNIEFFDNLWPLILKENICELRSKHNKIFYPFKTFDDIWGHTLLAERGFKNYEPPTELRCFQEKQPEEKIPQRRIDRSTIVCRPKIVKVSEQVDASQSDTWIGQYYSYHFVTRFRPWYMKKTLNDPDFETTDEMIAPITKELDLKIVAAIRKHDLKLLIIDAGTDIPLGEMEHWLPFCKFVKLLVIAHDKVTARRLRILGDIFDVIDFEEDLEKTWQKDLERALEMAFTYCIEHFYLDNMGMMFGFAFSKARGLCTIDTFEVLYKDLETMDSYFNIKKPVYEKDPCGCDVMGGKDSSEEDTETEIQTKCYNKNESNFIL